MSEKLSGNNGVFLFSSESGEVALLFRFRGAGFGFAGARTAVKALLTKFPTANLADADVPRNISPNDMAANEIIRTVRIGVFNLNMGVLLWFVAEETAKRHLWRRIP